jgi:hypothetical protein
LTLVFVYVTFAWTWRLHVPRQDKALNTTIWYAWIPISFSSYFHWNRRRKAELRGENRL